jgi:hypothetical protein
MLVLVFVALLVAMLVFVSVAVVVFMLLVVAFKIKRTHFIHQFFGVGTDSSIEQIASRPP